MVTVLMEGGEGTGHFLVSFSCCIKLFVQFKTIFYLCSNFIVDCMKSYFLSSYFTYLCSFLFCWPFCLFMHSLALSHTCQVDVRVIARPPVSIIHHKVQCSKMPPALTEAQHIMVTFSFLRATTLSSPDLWTRTSYTLLSILNTFSFCVQRDCP